METGVHSIWISEQLQELGHEVIVANVRELRAISHSDRKSDQVDAEKLARYARLDPNILRPIAHRTVQQQEALTLIRARALLVRLRTAAVNAVRGLTKACGHRMPASATRCFAQPSLAVMPPGLAQALGPVLQQIAEMTVKIKQYDRQIQLLGQTQYPETQALLKVHGVGHLTALTFVLTLGSKERFGRSRDVGCYLGLRPLLHALQPAHPRPSAPRHHSSECSDAICTRARRDSRSGRRLDVSDDRPAVWAMETRSLAPGAVCDRGLLGDGGVMLATLLTRRMLMCLSKVGTQVGEGGL
jgi:hypothetical protein